MIQEKRKIVSISMEVLLKNNENVTWNTKHNLVRIMFRSHEACANIKGIFLLTKQLVLQITLIIKFVFGTRVITKGCFFCKWDCNFVGGSGRYLHLVFCCQTWSYLKIVYLKIRHFVNSTIWFQQNASTCPDSEKLRIFCIQNPLSTSWFCSVET